ncbi:MAG: RNase III inhibitor [Erysipelothrix sp.]|nr:RNase III inhibitor [Erysipelothrix sp.]
MPFKIVRNDIIKMNTEAIVNTANSSLKMDGGLSEQIFRAAGKKELQAECDKIGFCQTGQAVITKGYKLTAKNIIHTVGPVWNEGKSNEKQLLYNAYKNSLDLALKHNIKSIAFPLISSGVYGYPKDQAIRTAITAITDFLLDYDMDIYLVVYGKESVLISEKLFDTIDKYIDDKYVEDANLQFNTYNLERRSYLNSQIQINEQREYEKRSLKDVISEKEETFSEMLLRLIDQKAITDVQAYKGANIDRRLFSKIRSDVNYNPSKVTVIAFAISLSLNLDETYDILQRAGYALSPSNKFDLIIEYFIESGNYNIYEINEALFSFGQMLLGA